MFNNPIHFIDQDGKDGTPYSAAYMNGISDAMMSNTVQLGFGRDLASEMYPNDLYAQKAFLEGQMVGDFVSLIMGGFTTDAGIMQLGGAGLLAINVEGAVITVPAATVTAVAAGVSIGYGTFVAATAMQGLKSSYDQLKMVNKKIDVQEAKSSGDGYVYKRVDQTGGQKDYVGKAKSDQRFEARKKEHQRANKDADYEFEVLERGKPGKDLSQKEQKHIDAGGGPTNKSNPNGGLSNKINAIRKK